MTAVSLRPGEQLASTVCTTRVVVVRAPAGAALDISCGGAPMESAAGKPAPAKVGAAEAVTLVGKRYVDADETVELLCTNSGTGELALGGVALTLKAAKALPASD
ncbi:hypothetical protein [Nocardia sp. alder85J]|uniref:hypothetical protein n=1 Tax=Nocardia sp. alder85J TaxID=2862949 RepID=UPI001CD686BD|nr:hypothetical protein [Nocardia sp. alder85J]MCX4094678.1 hypothetical protein [Nocardia sp. alder85J]